ncbi:MAG: outer membrane protein assembly factor BamD, partial [Betaproteobacteria bacterium]
MIIRLLLAAGAVALPVALLPVTRQESVRDTRADSVSYARQTASAEVPPPPWAEADAADSLYRAGREAINRGDFRRAAALFGEISAKYPRSQYAPDAPYWRAFALYKSGRDDDLR